MFKKLKNFYFYKKTIKNIEFTLKEKFNIRIDRAKRLYTVVNVPEELIGEAFSLKKSDIDRISENYVRQYYVDLGKELNKNGLMELFDLYEIKKVDKYSYLLIIGFSLFKSQNYYNIIYFIFTPIIVLLFLILTFLVFL
jgi:hypothetical protein